MVRAILEENEVKSKTYIIFIANIGFLFMVSDNPPILGPEYVGMLRPPHKTLRIS
jgi:hypothetical protein